MCVVIWPRPQLSGPQSQGTCWGWGGQAAACDTDRHKGRGCRDRASDPVLPALLPTQRYPVIPPKPPGPADQMEQAQRQDPRKPANTPSLTQGAWRAAEESVTSTNAQRKMLLEPPASKAGSSRRGISPCAHHPGSQQLGRAGLILETSEGLPSLRLVQQAWLRDAGEQAKVPIEMLTVLRGQDAGASSLSARQGLRSRNSSARMGLMPRAHRIWVLRGGGGTRGTDLQRQSSPVTPWLCDPSDGRGSITHGPLTRWGFWGESGPLQSGRISN